MDRCKEELDRVRASTRGEIERLKDRLVKLCDRLEELGATLEAGETWDWRKGKFQGGEGLSEYQVYAPGLVHRALCDEKDVAQLIVEFHNALPDLLSAARAAATIPSPGAED